MDTQPQPAKLGLALSGGGHRAAFFHVGVLARLAELGLLRRVQVISTVSGGSIVGALYYLHVKNLLESKPDAEISDADYVQLVQKVEREYREAAASNVRGSGWANLAKNFRMAKPTYSRTDRVAELYEERFYGKAWGDRDRRDGRIAMRDLLIRPKGHDGDFDPDRDNPSRRAPVPILLLEATTLNTGHNWRFEAMYMGEPKRQGANDEAIREDIDKNVILQRTKWSDLPPACQDFPLGNAVASSACFPGGFAPMQVPGLFDDLTVELVDGGVHDNQGIEGLEDRDCTHLVISDGSGQMPDVPRPSTRAPAVLGRVVSIYGDAEREQRLLRALARDTTAFMHLQTGLPASTRTPRGEVTQTAAKLQAQEFGVHPEVQHALAQVRTDLDAFCEVEAWSLMQDGYWLTGKVVPQREQVAKLGTPIDPVEWPFAAVANELGDPSNQYLKVLKTAKQQFLKPLRMTRFGLPVVLALAAVAAVAAAVGLYFLLAPHGAVLFGLGVASVVAVAVYVGSKNELVKPISIGVFDVAVPFLMAIPFLAVAAWQLASGRRWLRLGSVARLRGGEAPAGVGQGQPAP